MFKFLFCDSRIADPLIDRSIGVLPFEAEAKIVADAVGKQKVVPIPAQQFQGAEIKFVLQAHIVPYHQIEVTDRGGQLKVQPPLHSLNVLHCIGLHRADLVSTDKGVQRLQFFPDRIGRPERKVWFFLSCKHRCFLLHSIKANPPASYLPRGPKHGPGRFGWLHRIPVLSAALLPPQSCREQVRWQSVHSAALCR